MDTIGSILKMCFIVDFSFRGEIPGVRGFIKVQNLPATVTIKEDTPAGVAIFNFSVVSTSIEISLTPKIADTNPVNNFFAISIISDMYLEVTVSDNPGLDYETHSNYVLLIYVTDNKGYSDFGTLTVLLSDVNEPPRFLDNLANGVVYVDFLENLAVGAIIYEVQAIDPDRDDNILSYSVNSSLVTIHPSGKSGAILAARPFHYEEDFHRFTVLVTVKDTIGNSISGIVVVTLIDTNDNWPIFKLNETIFEMSEETPPNSVIGKVTDHGLDEDGVLSSLIYVMSTTNQYFTINSVTGELIVSAIIDRDSSPFRTVPTQQFEVVAKDSLSGRHAASMTVIVIIRDINDNPPFCFPHAHSIQIPETIEKGTTVVTISCADNDVDLANSQFTISLQPALRTAGRFALDGKNNDTIVVIGNLDFEATSHLEDNNVYVMSVVVTDKAHPHYQDTVTVYVTVIPVNEFNPSFTQTSYTFNISEFSEMGTKIGQVLAEDKDLPSLELIYSLVGGGSTLGYSQLFWMNPASGELHLVAQPEYEQTAQYLLTVQAVDKDSNDPKAATATVTVNILPANDKPPDCLPKFYSLMILDDTAVGTNIQGFQLACTDQDSSPQSFRYFITSGNINNHFRLSPSAGSNISKLILALPFDYTHGVDRVTNYNLLIQITDDNLLAGSRKSNIVQTGRVKINVRIIVPTPSTQKTTTTPNITYIRLSQNTYQTDSWYIPFIITLGCLLLLGMLGYLAYLYINYIRSIPKSKVEKKSLVEEKVTGNVYQYNTNSGARRWKDTKLPMKEYGNVRDVTPNLMSNINNETNFTQNSNMKEVHVDQIDNQKTDYDRTSLRPPSKLRRQNKVVARRLEPSQTLNSLSKVSLKLM
ncbi:cadherin-related family member 3-like [Chiloscyllium punctatum]|uniref:cadherin-related family member 3-like n=1 Tax=Chiloscyllium punctatum TaxID=137246 RepID=UPI003B63DF5C